MTRISAANIIGAIGMLITGIYLAANIITDWPIGVMPSHLMAMVLFVAFGLMAGNRDKDS